MAQRRYGELAGDCHPSLLLSVRGALAGRVRHLGRRTRIIFVTPESVQAVLQTVSMAGPVSRTWRRRRTTAARPGSGMGLGVGPAPVVELIAQCGQTCAERCPCLGYLDAVGWFAVHPIGQQTDQSVNQDDGNDPREQHPRPSPSIPIPRLDPSSSRHLSRKSAACSGKSRRTPR